MSDSNRPASGSPSAAAYRAKAARLSAAATKTNDQLIRAELESLARAYAQLAEKAERTAAATPTGTRPGGRADDV